MEKIENIELIKGTFTPREAREILVELLNSKINFHNLKNWSSHERAGKPDAHSEQRLAYLNESRKKVETFFAEHINEEKNVTINSNIEITIA